MVAQYPERVPVRAAPKVLDGFVSFPEEIGGDDRGLDQRAREYVEVVANAQLVELAGEPQQLRDTCQKPHDGCLGKAVSDRVSPAVAPQRDQSKGVGYVLAQGKRKAVDVLERLQTLQETRVLVLAPDSVVFVHVATGESYSSIGWLAIVTWPVSPS